MPKIMIIDDDPNIVTYLTDIFTDNGYDTCTAADGSKAMEVVEAEQPDLITLDIEMPDEWGPKFYRRLSQNPEYKRIPVIVVSGLAGNKYAVPKAVASLTKPFDPDELVGIVKNVLGA